MNATTVTTAQVSLTKKDLMEALETVFKMKGLPSSVRKVQYDSTLQTILVESVSQTGDKVDKVELKRFDHDDNSDKKTRINPGGFVKNNIGFSKNVNELIDGYRKMKTNKIPLNEFIQEIQFFFPSMSDAKVIQQLRDTRQFKGLEVNRAHGVVTF